MNVFPPGNVGFVLPPPSPMLSKKFFDQRTKNPRFFICIDREFQQKVHSSHHKLNLENTRNFNITWYKVRSVEFQMKSF